MVISTNQQTFTLANTLCKTIFILRYLYDQLCRNQIVDYDNTDLLVQIFRELPELLIYGEKHDQTIVEIFREKNIVYFFILFLHQRCASSLTFQIYQALNMIFENINNPKTLGIPLSQKIFS